MVTETVEPIVADPEPEVEQTEDAPQVQLEPAAAAEPEAAAAPDDRLSKLEAELQQLRDQQAERERREKQDQRRRQSQNALAAQERRRQEEDRREALDLLSAHLTPLGADATAVEPILERYTTKREGQITTRALSDAGDAFSVAAAEALGMDTDIALSERGEAYLANFQPFVQQLVERSRTAAEASLKEKGWKSPHEVEQAIDAGIKARVAEQQNGKRPLSRPEGDALPPARDMSPKAIVERVIAGTADEQDREAYRNSDVQARFRRGEN